MSEVATTMRTVDISEEKLIQVAKLHMTAFQGYANTRLGFDYVVALIRWFCEAEDAIALCALDGQGEVLGYVMGAPWGYARDMNRALIWKAAFGVLMRPWLILDPRFRRALSSRVKGLVVRSRSRQAPRLPAPVFSLVGIGVLPSARGKKVGMALVGAFEREALVAGGKSVRLSVYPDNLAARKLYEKSGWLPFPESNISANAMCYFKVVSEEA